MDSELRRGASVPPEDAWTWFTNFDPADIAIQRSLRSQTVRRIGPRDLVVERRLVFEQSPIDIRLEIHLRPPVAYDVRVHTATGAFDMRFEFLPAGRGCEILVTVRDVEGSPAADSGFRAQTLRAVAANLDDYIPAMERELGSSLG